jgi:hypothetical protein
MAMAAERDCQKDFRIALCGLRQPRDRPLRHHCEVLFEGDMDELYRVTSELLPGLEEPGVIRSSETFVVMKSHNKWLSLPKGVWDDEIGRDDLAADPGRE